jgi:hypothetical protein
MTASCQNDTNAPRTPRSALFVATVMVLLVGVAALSRFMDRLLPEIAAPNFVAVAAAGLFAAYVLRSWLAGLAVPVLAMAVSDLFIGGYDWRMMIVVYASMALPSIVAARWQRPSTLRITSAAMGAGLFFFLVTNLAWWAVYSPDRSIAGVVQAYVQALPFFKYTLAGNVVFAWALFDCHAAAVRLSQKRSPALAAA